MSDAGELHYRRTFVVNATAEHAFREFVNPIGGWWPQDHSALGGLAFVVCDPVVGGQWYDVGFDGTRLPRGSVRVWEPPRHLLLTWALGPPDIIEQFGESEFEMHFFDHGPNATRIDLEHRHMERTPDVDRIKGAFFSPYGWDLLVYNFAAYLASEPWPGPTRTRAMSETATS